MKKLYDFSKGKRGAVVSEKNKVRITIRLDAEILTWFKAQVHQAGGGNYQTFINEALHTHIKNKPEALEKQLRRVIREELRHAHLG